MKKPEIETDTWRDGERQTETVENRRRKAERESESFPSNAVTTKTNFLGSASLP